MVGRVSHLQPPEIDPNHVDSRRLRSQERSSTDVKEGSRRNQGFTRDDGRTWERTTLQIAAFTAPRYARGYAPCGHISRP